MNKLTYLIAPLMVLLAAAAYGTKYEYFRMTADNPTRSYDGDVAEVVNLTTLLASNYYHFNVDMVVGTKTFSYPVSLFKTVNHAPIPSLFVGECLENFRVRTKSLSI